MTTATPELIDFAATITKERGIKESDMTPALMLDVLREAVRRMEKVATEFTEGRTERAEKMRRSLTTSIYLNIVSRKSLERLDA
jgi:hypothetical protein